MERLISDEERIRRAEDVLERRRNLDYGSSDNTTDKIQSNKMAKRMFIQALICLCIYCGVYYIKTTKNENFNNMINAMRAALNYDVDFKQIYSNVYAEIQKINGNKTNTNIESNEMLEEKNEDVPSEEVPTDNEAQDVDELQDEGEGSNDSGALNSEKENLGIGGGFEENVVSEPISSELQMQMDAEYIKNKLQMINPLEIGVITSSFGSREASSIVSGNHKGIDLGASTGSTIIAAADGKVVEASSVGDFGTHLKLQNDDVVVIYAHCSELLVNEGDFVSKGQQIAKVGATRKGDRTTLAF